MQLLFTFECSHGKPDIQLVSLIVAVIRSKSIVLFRNGPTFMCIIQGSIAHLFHSQARGYLAGILNNDLCPRQSSPEETTWITNKKSTHQDGHMTIHSPSDDFLMLDLETRSFCFIGPPFRRSPSLSLALEKSCAVNRESVERNHHQGKRLQAAFQYHRLASSRFAGAPIPTSVK